MEQTVNQAIMECKAGKNREGNLNWIIQKFQPVKRNMQGNCILWNMKMQFKNLMKL